MDRLEGITAETGGPFTRAQALWAGFSSAQVRGLIERGVWLQVRRGVYVAAATHAAAAAAADERRVHAFEIAALLVALDVDACAAGTSAARIWGLDLLERPPSRLPNHHRARRYRVPVTSAARTVVDLARAGSVAAGVVVADSALRLRLANVPQLREVIRDCSGWLGLKTARHAVALADGKAESALESVSRVAMHEQEIAPPRTQVPLGDGHWQLGRVDFYWPQYRVIGEADGLGKYEANGRYTTREIVRQEKRREERLTAAE